MRLRRALVIWFVMLGLPVLAEPIEFGHGAAQISVFDGKVPVPWRLEADRHPIVSGALRLHGEAGIALLLEAVQKGVVAERQAKSDGCETRVAARDPSVRIKKDGRLVVAVTVQYQRWLCRRLAGRDLSIRLASETGWLQAEVVPVVVSGRWMASTRTCWSRRCRMRWHWKRSPMSRWNGAGRRTAG